MPSATVLKKSYNRLVLQIGLMAQYNAPYPEPIPAANPVQAVLNATLLADSTGAILRSTLSISFNLSLSETDCFDWYGPELTVGLTTTTLNTYWSALCSFLPISNFAVPKGNLLPAQNTTGRVEPCLLGKEWQRYPYNQSEAWFQEEYGFTAEKLDSVERLLIINAQLDLFSTYTLQELTLSSNRNHSRIISVSDQFHTEDTFPFWKVPKGQKPALDQVFTRRRVKEMLLIRKWQIRVTKLQYLKEWLGFHLDADATVEKDEAMEFFAGIIP
jgi:hypothetical protein